MKGLNVINQPDLTEIDWYRISQPTSAKYTFFSRAIGISSRKETLGYAINTSQ